MSKLISRVKKDPEILFYDLLHKQFRENTSEGVPKKIFLGSGTRSKVRIKIYCTVHRELIGKDLDLYSCQAFEVIKYQRFSARIGSIGTIDEQGSKIGRWKKRSKPFSVSLPAENSKNIATEL